jgi:5'-nucleotidase
MTNRVLLTNDDGIDAPGMAVLESIASQLGYEIWVVAPEHDQSGTSHSISLHAPLRLSERGTRRFGVSGTPGDCVVMAVRHLMKDQPPSLILSGVNRGANIGVETVFSGTVGAAMTGMLFGIRSIALSQAFSDRNAVRWETAQAHAPAVINRLLQLQWTANACINVNFPDKPPEETLDMVFTRQGRGIVKRIDVEHHIDPRGLSYHWLKFHREPAEDAPDSESTAIFQGRIAATPLQFERTAEDFFASVAV